MCSSTASSRKSPSSMRNCTHKSIVRSDKEGIVTLANELKLYYLAVIKAKEGTALDKVSCHDLHRHVDNE